MAHDKRGTDPTSEDIKIPDPVELSRTMGEIAERSQKLVTDFLARQSEGNQDLDPLNIGSAFMEMTTKLMANPARLMEAQMTLWNDYMNLWQHSARRWLGEEPDGPIVTPAKDDRRFKDAAWEENAVFDYIKQSYLLTARWMQGMVQDVEGLDDRTAKKVDFYTRQFVDAMAPSNFVMTNPEVLRTTFESGGENLVHGLENLLKDLEKGKGELRITMTDTSAFELGKNVGMTPGKVVYQNDLMQLIQYSPTTEQVHKRPLIIIPPWINKFYILDLREKNSLVKWAVDQGFTVFMISWVNPGEDLAEKGFEDYMLEGPLAAMEAVEKATGEKDANIVGYCLGGTLLASTLAYNAAKGNDCFKSATFLTTLTDFTEAGELSVFIDEEQLRALETRMNKQGYLDGSSMATTFNMLRANDLIWSFVVNNYLLGKDPFPFDLLFWNSDSTRMPAKMHSFYLRNMYQENKLVEPGGITLKDVPIDLRNVKTPTFLLSTREDHIAPWKATYAGTQLYSGPIEFVLSGSGHIAGVVNPPASNKYGHWVHETSGKLPATPDAWFETATLREGSWWPYWGKWLSENYGGEMVPARQPGDGGLPALEEAPGSYVKLRLTA